MSSISKLTYNNNVYKRRFLLRSLYNKENEKYQEELKKEENKFENEENKKDALPSININSHIKKTKNIIHSVKINEDEIENKYLNVNNKTKSKIEIGKYSNYKEYLRYEEMKKTYDYQDYLLDSISKKIENLGNDKKLINYKNSLFNQINNEFNRRINMFQGN